MSPRVGFSVDEQTHHPFGCGNADQGCLRLHSRFLSRLARRMESILERASPAVLGQCKLFDISGAPFCYTNSWTAFYEIHASRPSAFHGVDNIMYGDVFHCSSRRRQRLISSGREALPEDRKERPVHLDASPRPETRQSIVVIVLRSSQPNSRPRRPFAYPPACTRCADRPERAQP